VGGIAEKVGTQGIRIDLTKIKNFKSDYDFVLAEDVYLASGVLIANEGKRLDANLLKYIIKNKVGTVSIKKTETCPVEFFADIFEQQYLELYPEKAAELTEFKTEYVEKEKKTEETLMSIRSGRTVELEKSFVSVNDMLEKLNTKSDLFLYMNFIQGHDVHTFSHSNNVAMLANVFGNWLGLNKKDIMTLTLGGMFHDVGKTEIPKEIITKPAKLTEEEFRIVKNHPNDGFQMLKRINMSKEILMCALEHHEKVDGSGYPRSLKGKSISYFSKIIMICDIYEAMTAKRVYREKICPFEVIKSFETGMFGALDTELLLIFLKKIAENYLNLWVELSDGQSAKIVYIHPTRVSSPIVQLEDETIVDLAEVTDLRIVRLK
jgi:putative nucleotidyltransferase with HDIG domain